MNYCLQVTSTPPNLTILGAFDFARTALSNKHKILRVFFVEEAVQIAQHSASEELRPLQKRWIDLNTSHPIDMVICAKSAQHYNVINNVSCQLAAGFSLGGVTQLIDAHLHSTHTITFKW